ncbi:MAG: hypothetical protein EP329_04240 [Deltaproteobacteria bacterium]|nr:MAG: hypothetical protein EP329_04240 [Deltaproteobacteria bacterium]
MTLTRWAPAVVAFTASALVSWAAPARAEVELDWRGMLTSDLRLYVDDSLAFERSETTAYAKLFARLDPHVSFQGELAMVFTDYANPQDFAGLVDRTRLDPYRFESDSLFVQLTDLGGAEGLDLRVGRQSIIWGTADRFHPTSNLNPLDVEDPIAFGRVIANEMVSLAFRPDWTAGDEDEPWLDELALEAVFVPFFKPAQLPRSAGLAFTDRRVFAGRANTPLTHDLVARQATLEDDSGWDFSYTPRVQLPDRTLDNSMFAARIGARLAEVDLHVSYFRGFYAFPRAEKILANTDAIPHVDADIVLSYPRVQVLGFDAATSLDFLGGLGLWTEVAVNFHDDLYRLVSTAAVGVDDLEIEYEKGHFVKAVVGMDYTVTEWLYLNVQYLHGFVDEFGARELGNYVVAGGDFKIDHDRILLRFFNIFDLDDGTYVLFPQLVVKPWGWGELSLGSFVYSSSFNGFDETTKFESRAAGKSSVFLMARASL